MYPEFRGTTRPGGGDRPWTSPIHGSDGNSHLWSGIGADTNCTVNGWQNPVIRIRPGETQLWRLANIGANIYYRLHVPGTKFHVIAQDGHPVERVYSADSLVVPAAARYDVLVQGGSPGRSPLQTLAYDTGPAGNQFPQVDLATVVTDGNPVRPERLPEYFAPNTARPYRGALARDRQRSGQGNGRGARPLHRLHRSDRLPLPHPQPRG